MAPVGNEYYTLAIELHKTVAKWVSAKSQVFEIDRKHVFLLLIVRGLIKRKAARL